MMSEKNESNRWRGFFGLSPEGYHEVIQILCQRYAEEMQQVKRYTLHAHKMQYRQFRERLLRLAADEARHGEWLAEKINLLGGRLPEVPEVTLQESNSWQCLLDDLAAEKHCSEELIEKLQTIRNELPDVAAGLERIYEEGLKHRTEVREMLMRSDPRSNQPA